MPLFRYAAWIPGQNKKKQGIIDAGSREAAQQKLSQQGILITSLVEIRHVTRDHRLSNIALLQFTQDIAHLLGAQLPLYDSVLSVSDKHRTGKLHGFFLHLAEQLNKGEAFSSVLALYPKSFSPLYIAMVQAGERMGALPWVFAQLYNLLSMQQSFRKQLYTMILYPGFLLSFSLIVLFCILFFVIPSIQDLFEGAQLHPLTSFIVHLSEGVRTHWHFLLLGLGAFLLGGGGVFIYKKEWLFRGLLWIRPVKKFFIESALARFSRYVSVLLEGGVPLAEALGMAAQTIYYPSLKTAILTAQGQVLEGRSLSVALQKSPLIPPLVLRMLSLAEKSGNVQATFKNIANIYDQEVSSHVTQFTTMLQPAILLFLGLIVGVIVLAVLLPLSDIGSLIAQ